MAAIKYSKSELPLRAERLRDGVLQPEVSQRGKAVLVRTVTRWSWSPAQG